MQKRRIYDAFYLDLYRIYIYLQQIKELRM